jgi:hypothetical protein
VHELDHNQPKTMKELLNIATRHASGDQAVRPFLSTVTEGGPSGSQGAPLKVTGKGAKRTTKGNERGQSGDPNMS